MAIFTASVTLTPSCIDLTEQGAARSGWFVSLSRQDINRLIKTLRRARDAVFGRDE